MNFHLINLAAAGVLLGLAGGPAQAITVNFNGLIGPALGTAGNGQVYSEGGLTFTSDFLQHWGSGDLENADPGGATLYHSEVDPPLVVTRTAGGSFTLTSFALAEADNDTTPTSVSFNYTDGSGTFTSLLVLDATPGLQTFVVNRPGVTSFALADVDFQIDNIVYEVVAIPEPSSTALFLAGIGLLGALALRTRRGHL